MNPDFAREIKSGYVVHRKEGTSQKTLLNRASTNVRRSVIIATRFLQGKKKLWDYAANSDIYT